MKNADEIEPWWTSEKKNKLNLDCLDLGSMGYIN